MRNLSSKWKEKVNSEMDVQYLKFADITLKDGTKLNLTSADLWENGFTFEDAVSSDSSFDIGSVIVNTLTLNINNFEGQFSEYDFDEATVVAYVGMEFDDGTTEKVRICTVTVVEQPEDETVTIDLTCEDNMRKFDRNYSESKLVYPATRRQILRDACNVCGVRLNDTSFCRDDYIVQNRPDDASLTFRQVLQWVAQLGGQWIRCNEYGEVCVGWFSSLKESPLLLSDSGTLSSSDTELINSNGVLNPQNGMFFENDGTLMLYITDGSGNTSTINSTYSFTPQHTDVVITGIKVTEYVELSSDEAETFLSGEEGYVLSISGNKLITNGDGQTVAAMIAAQCVGMQFRPFEAECVTDVALEAGDNIIIVGRDGKIYTSVITSTTLKPGAGQRIYCHAQSAPKKSSVQYSKLAQTFVEARKAIKKEKTDRELAIGRLEESLKDASGLYESNEIQPDGSTISYLHDKPTLSESKTIIKFTAEAIGVSNDGGKTYPYGFILTGTMITKLLYAEGINADYIDTGAITVRDNAGNIIFQVDMDTKTVRINADIIKIGNKTLSGKITELENSISEGKNVTMTLTNEYQSIPVDSSGKIIGMFPEVKTGVNIYYGTTDIADECVFTITKSDNVSGAWDESTHTYTVTDLTSDSGWVDIRAVYLQTLAVTQRFTVAKLYSGADGTPGYTPKKGVDYFDGASSYLWIRYAIDAQGSGMTTTPTSATKYIGTATTTTPTAPTNASAYEWSKYVGENGIPGSSGYVHIAYADSSDGKTNFSLSVGENKKYIGQYTDNVKESSTDPAKYTWTLIKGADGKTPVKGVDYFDGTSAYIWIRYAEDASGKNMSATPSNLSKYVGIATTTTNVAPTDTSNYKWSLYVGKDGVPGESGYIHIAYADSADGKTGFDTTVGKGKKYIGQYTDNTKEDSTDPSKYTWTLIKGEDGKDATIYFLETSDDIITRSKGGQIGVSTVTFEAYLKAGETTQKSVYNGRFIVEETVDGTTWKEMYRSNTDESSVTDHLNSIIEYRSMVSSGGSIAIKHWRLSDNNSNLLGAPRDIAKIRCSLYAAGGFTTLIDRQTVTMVYDIESLSQSDIVDMLTQNGEWKGLYYLNGRLYMSFDAARGGILKLGGSANGNGLFQLYDNTDTLVGQFYNNGLLICNPDLEYGGYILGQNGIEFVTAATSTDTGSGAELIIGEELGGGLSLVNHDGALKVDLTCYEINADYAVIPEIMCDYINRSGSRNLEIGGAVEIKGRTTLSGYAYAKKLETSSTDKNLVVNSNGLIGKASSSSERYKDVGADISVLDIERWYNIQPVWAKYKDGYLSDTDERCGAEYPMFIAEDVEKYMPLAVDHLPDGRPETWNARAMIPAMFAMLKQQKKEIEQLQKRVAILEKKAGV